MGYKFINDPDFNFRVQVMLGGTPAGCGDVGEILTAASQVKPGDDPGWADTFGALAARIETIARKCHESGQNRSARDAYLRAATYFAAQLEAVQSSPDDDVCRRVFSDHRRCWDAFAAVNEPTLERLELPYEDATMPGFFLSVDDQPRPTIVFINGSDGSLTWVWQEMAEAHRRGFNSLIFDGPGQQSMLFERDIPFRPDWEAVITPVVNALVQRTDVNPDALVLWGGSQGGYWAPRTLAFEHRFAAAFLDPGVVQVATSWTSHFPAELLQLLDAGDKEDFDGAMQEGLQSPELRAAWTFRTRPYRITSPFELFTELRKYDITQVAHQITTPVMIADPDGEQFWPGQSAHLAGLVGDRAVLQPFTATEGADMHCEPMARSLVHQRMYDWLATVLPEARPQV